MKHGGLSAWQGNGLNLADGIATALLEAESISWRIFTLEPLCRSRFMVSRNVAVLLYLTLR